jgi:hypothetical protein
MAEQAVGYLTLLQQLQGPNIILIQGMIVEGELREKTVYETP